MADPRSEPSTVADELTLLTGFLDWHRETLVLKCSGLPDEQLRRRAVPTSNLSLMGLARHLTKVERYWFRRVLAGEEPGELFAATGDIDEDFNDLDAATGEGTLAVWRAEVEQCRRVVAQRSLDDEGARPGAGTRYSVRWVLIHMIEEYGRHMGHADLIREAIDGEVGE